MPNSVIRHGQPEGASFHAGEPVDSRVAAGKRQKSKQIMAVLDVVVSAKGAGIGGTVVDGADKPVADATVVTVPSSGKLGRPDAYQFGRTDENGHFALRGINPGEFLVLAFEEMQEDYRTQEFVKKYEGKGEKIELEEGGKKSVVLKLITEDGQNIKTK